MDVENAEFKYQCEFCSKMLKTPSSLNRHIKTHHSGSTPFKCVVCFRTFSNHQNLKVHLISGHKELLKYICEYCRQTFSDKEVLKVHQEDCEGLTKPDVRVKVELNEDADNQMKIKEESDEYVCTICNKNYSTSYNLKRHLKQFHDAQCDECHKHFASKNSLKRHKKKVHYYRSVKSVFIKPIAIKCENCKETFNTNDELKLHQIDCVRVKTPNSPDYFDSYFNNEQQEYNNETNNFNSFNETQQSFEQQQNSFDDFDGKNSNCDSDFADGDTEPMFNEKEYIDDFKLKHDLLKIKLECDLDDVPNSKNGVVCDFCNKTISSSYNLKRHIKYAHGDREKVICELCQKTFATKTSLDRHLVSCPQNKQQQNVCEFCKTNFLTIDELKLHSEVCLLTCYECSIIYESKSMLNDHIKQVHIKTENAENCEQNSTTDIEKVESKKVKCPYCTRRVVSLFNLKRHIRYAHQARKDIYCHMCKKKFAANESLKRHIRFVHVKEKYQPVKCGICKMVLACKDSLRRHVKYIHNKEKKRKSLINSETTSRASGDKQKDEIFYCEYCSKEYTKKRPLMEHILMKHGDGKTPWQCDKCQKYCRSNHSLKTHLMSHSKIKPYKCDQCGKMFANKTFLMIHTGVHTGERRFKCETCNKAFSQKHVLISHIRQHTGEKPFRCDHCSKMFATKLQLVTHVRVHTGEKPYKCPHCDKAFAALSSQRTHIRIHTGERPYSCDYCLKKFIINGDRKKHIAKVHLKNGISNHAFS